jgi:hypothetical protein
MIGRWRITEVDNWDQDAVDLVEPGFIELDGTLEGHIYFHLGDDSAPSGSTESSGERPVEPVTEALRPSRTYPGSGRTRRAGCRCPGSWWNGR